MQLASEISMTSGKSEIICARVAAAVLRLVTPLEFHPLVRGDEYGQEG